MRDFIKAMLYIINVVSFALVVFFGGTGVFHDILGPDLFEKILAKINIPWNFGLFCKAGYICMIILISTYFIRVKFFEE